MRLAAVAVAVAVLVAAGVLTSCGDNDAEVLPVVTIFGPYRGEEAALFTEGLDDWARQEGIDVRYTGSADFTSDLQYRVRDILAPPDIAVIPQPGLVRELAANGSVVALSDSVAAAVRRHYDDAVLDVGTVDGRLVGFPYRSNVKSLVWFRPEILDELGLAPPSTLTELESLVERLVAEGQTPWCMGIEAQSATGWPATDWVEDLIVRQQGPAIYRDWVAGDVPFADARIASAFDTLGELVLQPTHVAGGITAVLTTSTRNSDDPLFSEPPGCVLFKQASFAYGWMPEGLALGPDGDIDFFVLPGVDPDTPAPIVAGADLAVAFTDRPEVDAVLTRLATPAAAQPWAQGGSYLSLRNDVDPATYYRGPDRAVAAMLAEAETVVFDGSDDMPPEIGTTLFWSQITAWIAGQRSYDELADALDTARNG